VSIALYRLGKYCYRNKWLVLLITTALLASVGAAAWKFGVGTQNSFEVPGTESQQALDSVKETFPEIAGGSGTVVAIAPPGHTIDEPAMRTAVEDFVDEAKDQPGVMSVMSPWDELLTGAVSADKRSVLLNVQYEHASFEVTPAEKKALLKAADHLRTRLGSGATVSTGGDIFLSVPELSPTEMLGLLAAFVLLLPMLRSLRASLMPLLISVLGVGISASIIFAITSVIQVSSASPLLAVMIGLAVGIDYALFILSRHLDQLREGEPAEESAAKAVATAGSAVIFAGMTVGIALLGLSVAGIPFLAVMGVSAATGVAVAVAIVLTVTPALLGVAGESIRPKRPASKPGHTPFRDRFYRGWVRAVTRFPVVTIVVIVVALLALALPARNIRLAVPNNGTDPHSYESRRTYDLVTEHFGVGFNGPLLLTMNVLQTTHPKEDVDKMAKDVERVEGVALVSMHTPNEKGYTGVIVVIPKTSPTDPRTEQLVNRLRSMRPYFKEKYGFDVSVTGHTAVGIDISSVLGKALVPFGILVVGLCLLLLMIVFRSIVVPIKASLGYILSLAASFGVTGLVFINGLFAEQLHVTGQGTIISFAPIMVMGVLFGLAMDYEVFLVSRMREVYVHGATAAEAIEEGFVSSAPVVGAAAAIMFSVFVMFVPHGDFTIKPIALTLAAGVLIDAFVVRMALVPAVMALLGDRAWGLPPWLDRLLPHMDVEGEGVHRVLGLAEWPSPNSGLAVAAEGLVLEGRDGHPVDARLARGDVLVIEGARASGRSHLLLALTGRARVETGRAKVLGYVLPDEAEQVRMRIPLVLCEHEEVLDQLDEVLALEPVAIGIDDVDSLRGVDRAPFFERLGDYVRRSRERGRPLSLIVTTSSHEAVPAEFGQTTIVRLAEGIAEQPEVSSWALA
jgi:RND superfamily putative drug exporter